MDIASSVGQVASSAFCGSPLTPASSGGGQPALGAFRSAPGSGSAALQHELLLLLPSGTEAACGHGASGAGVVSLLLLLPGAAASWAARSSRMCSLTDSTWARFSSALSFSTRSTEAARFTPMACRRSSGAQIPTPCRISERSESYESSRRTSLLLRAPSPIGAKPSLRHRRALERQTEWVARD